MATLFHCAWQDTPFLANQNKVRTGNIYRPLWTGILMDAGQSPARERAGTDRTLLGGDGTSCAQQLLNEEETTCFV